MERRIPTHPFPSQEGGEQRLLRAVEAGQMPVSIAVAIAGASDEDDELLRGELLPAETATKSQPAGAVPSVANGRRRPKRTPACRGRDLRRTPTGSVPAGTQSPQR